MYFRSTSLFLNRLLTQVIFVFFKVLFVLIVIVDLGHFHK